MFSFYKVLNIYFVLYSLPFFKILFLYRLFHAGPGLTTVMAEANYELLNGSPPDRTWLLCANSLREKKIVPNISFGHILVEYGFQADYNFHEKTQSAWENSSALCFCSGTASWDWLVSFLNDFF